MRGSEWSLQHRSLFVLKTALDRFFFRRAEVRYYDHTLLPLRNSSYASGHFFWGGLKLSRTISLQITAPDAKPFQWISEATSDLELVSIRSMILLVVFIVFWKTPNSFIGEEVFNHFSYKRLMMVPSATVLKHLPNTRASLQAKLTTVRGATVSGRPPVTGFYWKSWQGSSQSDFFYNFRWVTAWFRSKWDSWDF